MIKGTTKILVKLTEGDETGVYRVNEDGQTYLAFPFNDSEEATKVGIEIAKILEVPFGRNLSKPIKPSEAELHGAEKQKEDFGKQQRKEERKQKRLERRQKRLQKQQEKQSSKKQLQSLKKLQKLQAKLEKLNGKS